jgi:hypothetical protein
LSEAQEEELGTLRQFEKILSIRPRLSLNSASAEISILFHLILECEISARLGLADKLVSYLGNNEVTQFQGLGEIIPCIHWNDSFLAIIVLLIADRGLFYFPLISLASLITYFCEVCDRFVFTPCGTGR